MTNKSIPDGLRFSHVYLKRDSILRDSIRFRKRLGGYYWEHLNDYTGKIAGNIQREIGIDIPFQFSSYSIPDLFEKAELRDLLDSITIIYKLLFDDKSYIAKGWLQFVQRAMQEENLGYRMDAQGGVHYHVDQEFEINRTLTLKCLGDNKYAAVIETFEDSYKILDSSPPDTKDAIRSIFESVEILYKIIIDAQGKDRLSSKGIQNNIKPLLSKLYTDDTVIICAEQIMDSLCDWIDAGHMYRHGQKVEELVPPPIDVAVNIISMGATYIRWLVSLTIKE